MAIAFLLDVNNSCQKLGIVVGRVMSARLCLWFVKLVVFLELCSAAHSYHLQELQNCSNVELVGEQNGTEVRSCPVWRTCNVATNKCECGSGVKEILRCRDTCPELALKTCYCMTYSKELNATFVSYCLYTCSLSIHAEFRSINSTNIAELNKETCGLYNRTGLMCGKCQEGHAPAVYSYNLACVECIDYKYNWIKYVAAAYIPLTFFFMVVIFLRVPITSGTMIAYVALSQIFAAPGLITFYSARIERASIKKVNVILIFYGIWNLDFFRSMYEPFCLHPKLTIMDIISLDYIVGAYPLILIIMTYFLVRLHDRFRLVTLMWIPVYRCMYRFRKEWNIKESLVKSFATFLLLSYVKIMNVSIELLTPAHLYYDVSGHPANIKFLFVNGSLEYLSKEHVPYAALAITMLTFFNFLPLILICAYPCQCCQKFINLFPFRQHTLHIFMDSLQGNYKEQPKDCRYFAGFYVALRMINLFLYGYLKSQLYYLWGAYMMTFFVILLAVKKPYKYSCYNAIDICLCFVMITAYIGASARFESVYITTKESTHIKSILNGVLGGTVMIFPLYGLGLLVYRILPILTIKKIAVQAHRKLCKFRQELNEYQRLE